MKNKWIWIGLALVVFAVVVFYGVDKSMCTAPCIQMSKELTAQQKSTITWRWTTLILYLLICFYDFMFCPIWYGLNRPDISQFMEIINSTTEPMVQMELMKKLTGQHNPFTLMGGGLFHLAFGAILTGSAFSGR